MLEEVKSYIPSDKEINVIDATFGGGGYSKAILENFNVNKLISIDRDPIAKIFAKEISDKFNNFEFLSGRFGEIDKLLKQNEIKKNDKYDVIVFDLGLSSNQLDNSKRGFSFIQKRQLDMSMGLNDKKVSDIVNTLSLIHI